MSKATWNFKDVLSSVPKTDPPAGLLAKVRDNIAKLPLDNAGKLAKRANDRVVVAEGDVERAKIALDQVIKENAERLALHEGYLAQRIEALEKANDDLVQAQMTFVAEARDAGALERIGPLVKYLQAIERQSKDDGK